MKRPKLKKASKRMTLSKKYRIRKNVSDHNRKVRKLAKKNKGQNKSRKDPGVPSSAPFKEEVLREAELKKQRIEEDRLRKKELRREEVNKRRGLESLQKDALNRQREFEQKNNTLRKMAADPVLGQGKETSRKSYYREFQKVVENSDVIVEVLDARDPLGCRCYEMEKTILDAGAKKIVLLINKIDLVPKENVEEWLKHLRNEFPTVAFKSNTQTQSALSHHKLPIKAINKMILSNTSQCVGADSLLKLLSNYCRNKNLQTTITVGVVGFPNVGKSSVINSLKRTRACNVGAAPGITKTMQEVSLNKHIKVLDCPGIVMAAGASPSAIVLRNCVNVSTLDDPVSPVESILSRCKKEQVMLRYKIGNYSNLNDFLEKLARRKGKLQKKGVPDVNEAARCVLRDWNSGRISYYTHPPEEKKAVHLNARIVNEMAKEFDWENLEEDNKQALKSITGCPSHSDLLLYKSEGPLTMQVDAQSIANDGVTECDDDSMRGDNDGSDMEEDQHAPPTELGNITIDVTEKKKKSSKVPDEATKSNLTCDGLNQIVTRGSNIQANQSLKQLMKLNKKKKKRADKLSDKLGDSLLSAMDFSRSQNDDYDFKVDYDL